MENSNLNLRVTFLSLLLLIGTMVVEAVNLKVGETYTCYLTSTPSYLKGCVWQITDQDALQFVSTPGTYSTSVQVKAVSAPTYSSPVAVQCTYYYMELDPVTGRYIYQRTGYQAWEFFITDNGPQGIQVYPSSLTMDVGDPSYRLSATVSPSTASQSVIWSVGSGYGVVSVSSGGYVSALSPGDAIVTATSTVNDVSGYCRVHVNSVSPTGISISPSSRQSLAINSTLSFSYSLTPSYATSNVTWSMTGDTDAATLSSAGVLKGMAEGTVRVTATTSNGYSASCYVDVYKPVPSSIAFSSADRNIKLPVNEGRTLSYTVQPSNAIYSVTWHSDAEQVATVSQSGYVLAKSPGTAHISVTTDNGKTDMCTVTVPPQPESITVTPSEKELLMGRKQQLSYSLTPADAVAKSVVWASSDNSIATVSTTGLVEARRPGMVNITATTDNGKVGVCRLTVPVPLFQLFVWMKNGEKTGYLSTSKPQFQLEDDHINFSTNEVSFVIDKDEFDKFTLEQVLPEHPLTITLDDMTVGLGQRVRVAYTLTPVDAQTQLTWFNSNPEVISVSPDGWLTGLSVGTAHLKVQTGNGLRSECDVTVPEPHYRFYVWLRSGVVESYAIEATKLTLFFDN